MKTRLVLLRFLLAVAGSNCFAQYSISGQLDTPEKNKRVYLSVIAYNAQYHMSNNQVISSTLTDSLGYFNFEGQLLPETHVLYRIHSNIDEESGGLDIADVDDLKNFHNFIFTNQDTISFRGNNSHWFSNQTNTNAVDVEWQTFEAYINQLKKELSAVSDIELKQQSTFQILSKLKAYSISKDIHPLATLLLLSEVDYTTLQSDFSSDEAFYMRLQDQLNTSYSEGSYAKQYAELLNDLSKLSNQQSLVFYKQLTYLLTAICLLLFAALGLVLRMLKREKKPPPIALSNLTKQEKKIAELICQLKSNNAIAAELFISLSTVKTHIRNIYSKLDVKDRDQLITEFKNHPRD